MLKKDEEKFYQWRAAGQCSNGDNCSFRHGGNQSGKSTPKSPVLLSRRKMVKNIEKRPTGWSRLGRLLENRAETSSRVSARNHRVIFGILPRIRIPRNHWNADSAKSVFSSSKRVERQPDNETEKEWRQQCCCFIEEFTSIGCTPRCRATETKF